MCSDVWLPQAMSPDGESIVTGAGDETLRFWNVFNKTRSTKVSFLCHVIVVVVVKLNTDVLLVHSSI